MPAELGSLLIQIPVVAAVIWFTLEITKRHSAEIDRRDEQMQTFLREQRDQNRVSLERIAGLLDKIDASMELHDRKMDVAITAMQERTKPRGRTQ